MSPRRARAEGGHARERLGARRYAMKQVIDSDP